MFKEPHDNEDDRHVLSGTVEHRWLGCQSLSIDPGNHEWSARCFEQKDDGRHVKARYRKNLHVDRRGVALILIAQPRELVAVDRRGKVAIPDIRYAGDFDYPYEQNGMSRFSDTVRDASGQSKTLCGYFSTRRFRIVVPAQFDACQAFHDGKADACKDCSLYCTEPECQNSVLIGGQGYAVQPDGSMHMHRTIPSKERLCSRPELLLEREIYKGKTWLRCVESILQVPPRPVTTGGSGANEGR